MTRRFQLAPLHGSVSGKSVESTLKSREAPRYHVRFSPKVRLKATYPRSRSEIKMRIILLFALLGTTACAVAPVQQSAQDLQRAVDIAIANQDSTMWIPGGVYNFSTNNFRITGANGLRFLAPETVFLMFSGSSGVNISHTTDLSLANWTIDYPDDNTFNSDSGGSSGITFHMFNSTRVHAEDITIHHAPYFAVTAFNGGGGHYFRRLNFAPVDPTGPCIAPVPSVIPPELCHMVSKRDAIHFSDLRAGCTIEESRVGYSGDDFFNVHTTLMLVLSCNADANSCLMVNPHLPGVPRNTVYGSNSVMETVVPGDEMSFFSWPDASFMTTRFGDKGAPPLRVKKATRVTDPALLEQAATLPPQLGTCDTNPVFCTNQSVIFDASDLWRVEFSASTKLPAGVGRTALVQIDSISNAGTVLRNNLFTNTSCNLGRYKSSDSVIEGNTFVNGRIPNLELTWLPQFFEGPVRLKNVSVADNIIRGEGAVPIHCGPWCENPSCVGPPNFGPWAEKTCAACPDCTKAPGGRTEWTSDIRLRNNTVVAR